MSYHCNLKAQQRELQKELDEERRLVPSSSSHSPVCSDRGNEPATCLATAVVCCEAAAGRRQEARRTSQPFPEKTAVAAKRLARLGQLQGSHQRLEVVWALGSLNAMPGPVCRRPKRFEKKLSGAKSRGYPFCFGSCLLFLHVPLLLLQLPPFFSTHAEEKLLADRKEAQRGCCSANCN